MPCLVSDLTGGHVTPQFGLPSLALGQAVSDTGDVYFIVLQYLAIKAKGGGRLISALHTYRIASTPR